MKKSAAKSKSKSTGRATGVGRVAKLNQEIANLQLLIAKQKKLLELRDEFSGLCGNPNSDPARVKLLVELSASRRMEKVEDIYSHRRPRRLAETRFIVIALAKDYTRLSLSAVGRLLGMRDHSAVVHAIHRAGELREVDQAFAADYAAVEQDLVRRIKSEAWLDSSTPALEIKAA